MKKSMVKKWVVGLLLGCNLLPVYAAEDGPAWDKAPVRLSDQKSLQNGAKTFATYCLSCHSASYMRYNRLQDIGLTPDEIENEIIHTNAKIGDTMRSAISEADGKEWFGKAPPDLSIIARSRAGAKGSGADYLYTYLRSFYRDSASPTGWNNIAFPYVGMPNVFWQLEGERRAVFKTEEVDGQKVELFQKFEQITPGTMSPQQYDQMVGDLVNYLQWMGEPAQIVRKKMGVWVLLFLALLIFVTWRMNKAFWKEVR